LKKDVRNFKLKISKKSFELIRIQKIRIKTGPLLTLDRPENFQGKMAVFTAKLQFLKKIRQTI
jgi:hypothetical protein